MAAPSSSTATAAAKRIVSLRGGVGAPSASTLSSSSRCRWASTSAQTQAAPSTAAATATPTPPRKEAPINASLVLSRQPVIMRSPTSFESAVFQYNYALYRRLQQPLNRDIYFKKGSAAQVKFDAEEAARKALVDGGLGFHSPEEAAAAAAEAGKGGGKGKKGAAEEEPEADTADSTLQAERELFKVAPRTTPADAAGDTASLERALDRTLFLVFKEKSTGRWKFPEKQLDWEAKETLHRAAVKPVKQALGEEMDIWTVTNMPVAVLPRPGGEAKQSTSNKTYFIRAHIVKGHPEVQKSQQPSLPPLPADHAWLTREEIEERILAKGDEESRAYWEGVRDLLAE